MAKCKNSTSFWDLFELNWATNSITWYFYGKLLSVFPDDSYGPNPTFGTDCTRPGYQSYFESCFRLDTEPKVYEDAKAMCAAENAALATINNGYDEAFVETVMLSNGFSNVWIGLQRDPVIGISKGMGVA